MQDGWYITDGWECNILTVKIWNRMFKIFINNYFMIWSEVKCDVQLWFKIIMLFSPKEAFHEMYCIHNNSLFLLYMCLFLIWRLRLNELYVLYSQWEHCLSFTWSCIFLLCFLSWSLVAKHVLHKEQFGFIIISSAFLPQFVFSKWDPRRLNTTPQYGQVW